MEHQDGWPRWCAVEKLEQGQSRHTRGHQMFDVVLEEHTTLAALKTVADDIFHQSPWQTLREVSRAKDFDGPVTQQKWRNSAVTGCPQTVQNVLGSKWCWGRDRMNLILG